MSLLTLPGNEGALFSRKEFIPSLASSERPLKYMPRLSILCASIGWSMVRPFHIMWRIVETETGALSSMKERANARAAEISSGPE